MAARALPAGWRRGLATPKWEESLARLKELQDGRSAGVSAENGGNRDALRLCRADTVRECAKASQWSWALRLAQPQTGRFKASMVLLTVAIGACGKGKQWEKSLQCLAEAPRLALRPDTVMYNAVLHACDRASQWGTAVHLLRQMRVRVVVPDVVSFSTVIPACSKGQRWDLALGILREMPARSVEANLLTLNAAISACERGQKWLVATELFEEVVQRGFQPDVITFNSTISACEKGQEWARAVSLFAAMNAHSIQPNIVTYNATVSACGAGHQWEASLSLLSSAVATSVGLDTISYTSGIDACGGGQMWDWALWLLRDMLHHNLDVDVISWAAAIGACQKWQHAVELLAELQQRQLRPSVIACNATMNSCERGSAWAQAVQLFASMPDCGVRPNTVSLNILVKSYCTGSCWKGALEVISEAPALSVLPNAQTYTEALESLHENPSGVKLLWHNMQATNVQPDNVTYFSGVRALVGAEDMGSAAALYREGVDQGVLSHWHPSESRTLDLHGYSPEAAQLATRLVIGDELCGISVAARGGAARPVCSSAQSNVTPVHRDLIIVVGVGKHSLGGQLVLGPVVLGMLVDELGLGAEPIASNPGRILVLAADLKRLALSWDVDCSRPSMTTLGSQPLVDRNAESPPVSP